jgi:hypothetical protein
MVRAGAAVLDITPPLGVPLAGSFTERIATGIDDPLFARAVVLEDDQGPAGRLAIVCADLICMPGETVRAAREQIGAAGHIPPERVLIAATHTHTAPSPTGLLGTRRADAYMDALPARLATVVGLAVERLRPARLAWGTGWEAGVSFHRRYRLRDGTVRMNPGRRNPDVVGPVGPIDPELGVLWIEQDDGAPLASVASFALHYIGTDHAQHVSADYFGHYARWMQRLFGAPFAAPGTPGEFVPILLNGASGDINGVDVQDTEQPAGHRLARRVAGIVAGETLRVVQRLRPTADVSLAAASARLSFRRKRITDEDLEIAGRLLALDESVPPQDLRRAAGLGRDGPFSWVVGQPLPDSVLRQYARECRLLAALPEQLETEVQVLRAGGCAIVALPGEIFVELGLAMKGTGDGAPEGPAQPVARPGAGSPITMIASLANDYVGYVATRRAIEEDGGYETWAARSALPAAGTGEAMVALARRLLAAVALGHAPAPSERQRAQAPTNG